jgi:hypothetical protein
VCVKIRVAMSPIEIRRRAIFFVAPAPKISLKFFLQFFSA